MLMWGVQCTCMQARMYDVGVQRCMCAGTHVCCCEGTGVHVQAHMCVGVGGTDAHEYRYTCMCWYAWFLI